MMKFFLGGWDGEMARIAAVLDENNVSFWFKELKWGEAKASVYADEIAAAAAEGKRVVLVELEVDITVPEGTIVVDHHGSRSGEPASLLQVLALIGVTPTRRDELFAANDAAWFDGLMAAGATREEMLEVRAADRAAQGITREQENEAERALTAPVEMIGNVRVIRMAHSKCAPVGDRLAVSAITAGKPIPQYLVLSQDGEVNFSGDGALCVALKDKFQGWNGGVRLGKSGETAYWGGYPNHDAVVEFVRAAVGT